jgi:OFA family oxalate/formate antiporter-like MFS transporter
VITQNRWLIAVAGVLMQVAFGAVYAWSVFRIALSHAHGWTIAEVTAAFEIAIFVDGLAAFAGGLWMKRSGPRPVGIAAAILYGLGTILTGTSHDLTALYLTYGVIGGAGLGLGYIVPIATLVKWFPDRRGMITGLAVAGFGAGALITAPAANSLMASVGVGRTFEVLGLAYLVVVFGCALFMRNPPEGYAPDGYRASAPQPGRSAREFTLRQALGTWQWCALWLTLFLNTTAGIAIISQASPMAQEISGVSAATAAGMVGLISIANGSGRFLWAWFSDAVGRRTATPVRCISAALAGSSVRPALVVGVSHLALLRRRLRHHAGIRHRLLWGGANRIDLRTDAHGLGCAAIFGPSLVAGIRQATGHYQGAMRWLALATLVSAVVPLLLRLPRERQSRDFSVQGVGAAPPVRS